MAASFGDVRDIFYTADVHYLYLTHKQAGCQLQTFPCMPPSAFQRSSYGSHSEARIPSIVGERCKARIKPPIPIRAVNNQHSHIEEEFQRMQQMLAAPDGDRTAQNHQQKQHVYHDTELHPYQRQPHRHVHHAQTSRGANAVADAQEHEVANAVELSYQYSSNIVNYRVDSTPETHQLDYQNHHQQHGQERPLTYGRPSTPAPRPPVYRARVDDYSHPSILSRDIIMSLYSGGKLLLELPDEPGAVSSLLTALGRAAAKLRAIGLAMALDPVYDPAAGVHGCSTFRHNPALGSNGGSHHHSSGVSTCSTGGSPSASMDVPASPSGASRRQSDGCFFVLCARAVPIPPAGSSMAYTVGSSMGQQVLRVGPSSGMHALLPALLQAILRDGLVTLRCSWLDEETDSDSWSDDEGEDPADRQQPTQNHRVQGGEAGGAPAAAAPPAAGGGGFSPLSSQDLGPGHPAGSLVQVPCVLRAIFKLDRQLRGLDLGGLVLLPHAFTRVGANRNVQVLHLDVVIA